MSKFQETMANLGYTLEEKDDLKLTYKKRMQYSDLFLVFDLGLKTINPILVPKSVILYEKDINELLKEFRVLRNEGKRLAEMSVGFHLLNASYLEGK